MRMIIILLLSLATALPVFSQYFQPISPLAFDKNSLSQSAISRKITAERKLFDPLDIDELRVNVRKNNNQVDNKLSALKNKMTNIYLDKQELLKLVDIEKMEEQIKVKQKSLDEIKVQIQQDLANVGYSGLYLVLLNEVDPFASKESLSDQSEKLLAPVAIEDLNGIFISGLTVMQDNRILTDHIKAVISGEMSVAKQYISKTIDGRSKFLYLVKVQVSPLKKGLAATQTPGTGQTRHLVINLLKDTNFKPALRNAGLAESEINSVDSEANLSREVIMNSNATAGRQQQLILSRGQTNLQKIESDIEQLKNSLTNRSTLLKQTIQTKTNVTYNSRDISGSIDRALKYFDSQLKSLQDELVAEKEKELVARYAVNVTVEGKPEQDIAKTATGLLGQIKQSYSKVEQFIRVTDVVNQMLVADKTGSGKDIIREVDKLWLFPVAGDADNFLLTVVAQFKIADIRDHAPERQPTITERPTPHRETITTNGIEMVLVKGGTFQMGSNDGDSNEKPIHEVSVDDFYLSKYEVTQKQWVAIMGNNPSYFKGDNLPVESVSWNDVQQFIRKLNTKTGVSFRLPTEAEWEYAARGGNKSKGYKYSGSDNVGSVAWYSGNSNNKTHPVGTKQPNELGLYDMSGNVWEWCADWYGGDYYSKSPYENPTGPATGASRVNRGGSWNDGAGGVRCANRNDSDPDSSDNDLGFRRCRAVR